MKRIDLLSISLVILLAFAMATLPRTAANAKQMSFIRDAEIENTIRLYTAPLLEAAGIPPYSVKIHLVKDNSLNAFVANGLNLFVNTGLLQRSANANQVIGVLAHEVGHISGGHLARMGDAIKGAQAKSFLGYILGGAAIIAGRPDVGAAVIAGGQQAGMASFLSYNRAQESAADQAALSFLDATHQSSQGLRDFMGALEDQELVTASRQDPYARTHPITRNRIRLIEAHLEKTASENRPTLPLYQMLHQRMVAKLNAFINPTGRTLRQYKADDPSLISRYARSVAFYRKRKLDESLALIDGLLAEHPTDPYFWELKGQMLFENGRLKEALAPYEAANKYLPGNPLLLVDLARVQIELNDPNLLKPAIKNLKKSLASSPNSPFALRQLAIAAGKDNQFGISAAALAEEAYLLGRKSEALHHINKAEELLPRGSREWLRLQDIKVQIEGWKDEEQSQ